jgi:hypothetical protein
MNGATDARLTRSEVADALCDAADRRRDERVVTAVPKRRFRLAYLNAFPIGWCAAMATLSIVGLVLGPPKPRTPPVGPMMTFECDPKGCSTPGSTYFVEPSDSEGWFDPTDPATQWLFRRGGHVYGTRDLMGRDL